MVEYCGPLVWGAWLAILKAPGAGSSPTTRETKLRACLKNVAAEVPLDLGGGGGRAHDGMWMDRTPVLGMLPGGLCSARPAWVRSPEDMDCMAERVCVQCPLKEVVDVRERVEETGGSVM